MVRKRKPPEHVNHERWLVSYADFITLLFAFFTTMYAISTVDAQKLGKMVMSVRASFDSTVFPSGSDKLSLSSGMGATSVLGPDVVENVNVPKEKVLESKVTAQVKDLKANFVPNPLPRGEVIALSRLRTNVELLAQQKNLSRQVSTRIESRGLVISLGEGGFFDSGSDQLKQEGLDLLDDIAVNILGMKNQLRVEGHTDNVPIHTSRFPSNWELSTSRATSIVAHLARKHAFSPERLSAAGYGEFRPIDTNDTPEGRARNRRVDIVVLNSLYSGAEPK